MFMLAITALVSACSKFSPDAGHEIVLVAKPWFFGHGGVLDTPVETGLAFGALTTDGIDVNVPPQKYELRLNDTMTSDGVPVDFHAVMVLRVTDSVALIKNFGPKWYANNLEAPFNKMIRQAVRKRGMNETAISTTAIEEINKEIEQELITFIKEKKLPVELVTIDEAGRGRARRFKSCGAPGVASHQIGDASPATRTADGASMRLLMPAAVHGTFHG